MKQTINKKINKIFTIIVICIVLIITNVNSVSFAKGPTNLVEPEENQYLELKAVEIKELETAGGEKEQQLIMELWGNNLEFKGFNVRFSYDTTKVNLSSLQTNEEITNIDSMSNQYFKFENEFENALDFTQISEQIGIVDITVTFNPPINTTEHIVDKGEGIGKVVDTGQKVKLGRISFKMVNEKFDPNWFSLVKDSSSSPITGIKININGNDKFENESTFRFTDGLTGTVIGQIFTAPTASKGIYKATIKAYPQDKVKEIIDWNAVIEGELDDIHKRLLTLDAKEVETEDDGTYEIELSPGIYDILVDKPGYLDQIYIEIEVNAGEIVDLGYVELLAGDITKDGKIEIEDVGLLMNVYGIDDTSADYEMKYDFNDDQRVEIEDIGLLMNNYLKIRNIKKGKE